MKFIRPILFTLLFAFIVGCRAFGLDYDPAVFTVEEDRAMMEGVIDGTTPERVEQLIEDYPNVTTIVLQQVDGSADDEANLVASRIVRQHGFATHVPADGEIASGGVDFFLAGRTRTVEDGARLGVHSWAAGFGETGADLPKDDPQHQLYLDYYEEMGSPADFYWFTLEAAPAECIHWMTASEIAQYGMVTSEP